MSELSGTLSADVSPVLQLDVPAASRAMRLTMHVLSEALGGFVTGNGGPNRHPALVQVRLLPVSAAVVGPSVSVQLLVQPVTFESAVLRSGTTDGSGTLTPVPPKYRPPHANVPAEQMPPGQSFVVLQGSPDLDPPPAHTLGSSVPPSSFIMPQVPLPIFEVNCSMVGSGVPHAQAVVVSHVQLFVHTCPPGQPGPQGGSHASFPVLTPLPQRVFVQFESQPSPSTVFPSSHSSSPATTPSPQTAGIVVGVTFTTGHLQVVSFGLQTKTNLSLSVRLALPLPVETRVRRMTAVPGLSCLFPLSLTWKLSAKAAQAAPPLRSDWGRVGSVWTFFTPITRASARLSATGLQAESPVWFAHSATRKVHAPSGVASASQLPSQSLQVNVDPLWPTLDWTLSSTRQASAAFPFPSP